MSFSNITVMKNLYNRLEISKHLCYNVYARCNYIGSKKLPLCMGCIAADLMLFRFALLGGIGGVVSEIDVGGV